MSWVHIEPFDSIPDMRDSSFEDLQHLCLLAGRNHHSGIVGPGTRTFNPEEWHSIQVSHQVEPLTFREIICDYVNPSIPIILPRFSFGLITISHSSPVESVTLDQTSTEYMRPVMPRESLVFSFTNFLAH